MTNVDIASLVLHVLAAAGIVAGGVVMVIAGGRVRQATTGTELAQWARFTRSGTTVVTAAALMPIATGGHLAGAVWGGQRGGFENPFITLGLLGWLVLVPVGPMLGGARLRRLAVAADEHVDAALPAALRLHARQPALWGAVHSLVGVSVGLIWLMVAKPGWIVGTAGLLGTFVIGWATGVAVIRRASTPAADGFPQRPRHP